MTTASLYRQMREKHGQNASRLIVQLWRTSGIETSTQQLVKNISQFVERLNQITVEAMLKNLTTTSKKSTEENT